MNKKQLLIKLLTIVVGGISVFLLSSCFTTLRILSCKKSCMESCNSSDDNISGHEYGIYYSLSNSGDFYWVDEVGYKETEVVIPETHEGYPVMKIRSGAFTHCKYGSGCAGNHYFGMHLSSLTLPKTIIAIESGVFAGYPEHYRAVDPYYREGAICDKLIYEGTVEDWCNIQFGSSPFTGVNEFYIGEEKVTDLVIPEAVTTIPENAFTYYGGLKSITLHEGVTKIEEYAFYGCYGLKEITFPCTNLTIGECAFANCYQLEEIAFTGEQLVLGESAFATCISLKNIEWNTVTVTEIPRYAFSSCCALESFVIPASVEDIGTDAFAGCYNLTEVYNLSTLNVVAGSTSNGYVAYYAGVVHTAEEDNAYILTDGDYKFVVSEEKTTLFKYTGEGGALNLPVLEGGKTYDIRSETFYNNDTILSVNIPDCVTEIGARAFENCDNLKIVSDCAGIVTVGDRAFADCRALESVALVKVETIGNGAFADSRPLKILNLPATVKEIGKGAFSSTGTNTQIKYAGTLEDWAEVTLSEAALTEVTVTCSDGEWVGKI